MTPGQKEIIEAYVRLAVAETLDVPIEHVRPTTRLFVGRVFGSAVTFKHLKTIAERIENINGFKFPTLAYEGWTDVSDIVTASFLATDRRVAA